MTEEDAVRVEDRYGELLLELAQRAEEPVDRAAGPLRSFLRGDDEEAAVAQFARRFDRLSMRRPRGEEAIDTIEELRCLRAIERWRHTENPDVRIVGELFQVSSRHIGL